MPTIAETWMTSSSRGRPPPRAGPPGPRQGCSFEISRRRARVGWGVTAAVGPLYGGSSRRDPASGPRRARARDRLPRPALVSSFTVEDGAAPARKLQHLRPREWRVAPPTGAHARLHEDARRRDHAHELDGIDGRAIGERRAGRGTSALTGTPPAAGPGWQRHEHAAAVVERLPMPMMPEHTVMPALRMFPRCGDGPRRRAVEMIRRTSRGVEVWL